MTKQQWESYILETGDVNEYIDRLLIAGKSLSRGDKINIGKKWYSKHHKTKEEVLKARSHNDYYMALNRIQNRRIAVENDFSTDLKRRWTLEDCQIFVGMKVQEKNISEIAEALDRSYDSIKLKSEQYGWIIDTYKLQPKESLLNNITFVIEELLKPYSSAREEYKGEKHV